MQADQLKQILAFQKDEITTHLLYQKLGNILKDAQNAQVMREMSAVELEHYKFWHNISKKDVKPDRFKVFLFVLFTRDRKSVV